MNATQLSTQQRTSLVERADSHNAPPQTSSFRPDSGPLAAPRANPSDSAELPRPGAAPVRELSDDQVQRISKAIADPQRFAILASIAEQVELPCKTLVANLSIKQATISHHLKELASAQLIESRKQGQRAILSCRRDVCDAYVRALESRFVLAAVE